MQCEQFGQFLKILVELFGDRHFVSFEKHILVKLVWLLLGQLFKHYAYFLFQYLATMVTITSKGIRNVQCCKTAREEIKIP